MSKRGKRGQSQTLVIGRDSPTHDRGRGQAVVEMLLVLPAFLGIIFVIMEFGNIAFQTVLLNHATWEAARIGAMTACPKGARPGGCSPSPNISMMQGILSRVIATARILGGQTRAVSTIYDNQAQIMNYDLVVTSQYDVPLIFPISNFLLSSGRCDSRGYFPSGGGTRAVCVTVKAPIEQPLPQ